MKLLCPVMAETAWITLISACKPFSKMLQGLQQCPVNRSSQQGSNKTAFFVPGVRSQHKDGCKCGQG